MFREPNPHLEFDTPGENELELANNIHMFGKNPLGYMNSDKIAFYLNVYLFILRERERERACAGEGQREREEQRILSRLFTVRRGAQTHQP